MLYPIELRVREGGVNKRPWANDSKQNFVRRVLNSKHTFQLGKTARSQPNDRPPGLPSRP